MTIINKPALAVLLICFSVFCFAETTPAKKPWHGRFVVDLSSHPELAKKPGIKQALPTFVLGAKELRIEMGSQPGPVAPYEVKGQKLFIKTPKQTLTGTFGKDFDYFILDGGENPKYVKEN